MMKALDYIQILGMKNFVFFFSFPQKVCCRISGFSLTPYLESFTPTFGLGTPVFPRISSNLHCGTPTFSKRCLWDSYFQNPSENPESTMVYAYTFLLFSHFDKGKQLL